MYHLNIPGGSQPWLTFKEAISSVQAVCQAWSRRSPNLRILLLLSSLLRSGQFYVAQFCQFFHHKKLSAQLSSGLTCRHQLKCAPPTLNSHLYPTFKHRNLLILRFHSFSPVPDEAARVSSTQHPQSWEGLYLQVSLKYGQQFNLRFFQGS